LPEDTDKFVSLAEINEKIQLKKNSSKSKDDIDINENSCFFFY